MSIYLEDIPLEKAKEVFRSALKESNLDRVLGTEIVDVNENALGRILAKPLIAKISSPSYNSSAMDGFAISSKDIDWHPMLRATPALSLRLVAAFTTREGPSTSFEC